MFNLRGADLYKDSNLCKHPYIVLFVALVLVHFVGPKNL